MGRCSPPLGDAAIARRPAQLLSLAAGTLRDVSRLEAIGAAHEAGYGAVGLRFDLHAPERTELAELRRRLNETGLDVLDVEVVRLSPAWSDDLECRLVEWAHALGARHLLVVTNDPDRARAATRTTSSASIPISCPTYRCVMRRLYLRATTTTR